MSMPSDSHSSTRATRRSSGQCRLRRASAALSSQRWFGVWTPPSRSGSIAASAIRSSSTAKGRNGSGASASSAYVSHRSLIVNAVSGGDARFSPSNRPFSPCIAARNATSRAAARAASADPKWTESGWTAQATSVFAADMTARWWGSLARSASTPSRTSRARSSAAAVTVARKAVSVIASGIFPRSTPGRSSHRA
jgi:hypothetical protein